MTVACKADGKGHAGLQWPCLLVFRQPAVEERFISQRRARVRAHDQQAAAVYLAMVAAGTLLYLIISTFIPAAKANRVDCCLSLIICSWIGPAAHLALLMLLPDHTYQQHRALITVGFRVFYLLATSINGFGVCGVGSINATAGGSAHPPAGSQLESLMSALLWRSGVIGLVWYSGAFPLLFWQHCLVQTGFLLVYCKSLSPLVCMSINQVQDGPHSIAIISSAAQHMLAQLLAALGAHGLALQHAGAAAARSLAASSGNYSSYSSYSSCMHGLCFLQLVVGHALPSFLLYVTEARSRQRWLAGQQQRQSGGGSTTSCQMHGFSGCSYSSLCRSVDEALAAAAVAEGEAPGGPGKSELVPMDACKVPAAAGAIGQLPNQLQQQQQQEEEGKDRPFVAPASCSKTSSSCSVQGLPGSARTGVAMAAASAGCAGTPPTATAAAAAAAAGSAASLLGSLARRVRCISSASIASSSQGEQPLLGLAAMDAFEEECQAATLPPSFQEVYVLLLALGLAWLGLGQIV